MPIMEVADQPVAKNKYPIALGQDTSLYHVRLGFVKNWTAQSPRPERVFLLGSYTALRGRLVIAPKFSETGDVDYTTIWEHPDEKLEVLTGVEAKFVEPSIEADTELDIVLHFTPKSSRPVTLKIMDRQKAAPEPGPLELWIDPKE